MSAKALGHPKNVVFVELSEALDMVIEGRVLEKLKAFGTGGSFLPWIGDFPTGGSFSSESANWSLDSIKSRVVFRKVGARAVNLPRLLE